MYDSYKVVEKYPELKNVAEPIKVYVGKALQELLESTIYSVWGSETRAETVYYDGYPVEECNCSEFESEYQLVLNRIEKHPATLNMNYEELPEDVKIIFEKQAEYLLKKMKELNFNRHIDIDIEKIRNEFFITFCPGHSPIIQLKN